MTAEHCRPDQPPHHLRVVRRPPDDTLVAVIEGGDATRSIAAAASARDASRALRDAGYRVETVAMDGMDARVVALAPHIAVPTVLGADYALGIVQQQLELRQIECVGSTSDGFESCGNRLVAKAEVRRAGLRAPHALRLSRRVAHKVGFGTALPAMMEALGPRVLMRPLVGTGYDGWRTVSTREHAAAQLLSVFTHTYDEVTVERHIDGVLISTLVIGPTAIPKVVASAAASRPAEFEAGQVPFEWASAPSEPADCAEAMAAAAYRALGCRDIALIDTVVDADGSAWFLDAQTAIDYRWDGKPARVAATAGTSIGDVLTWIVGERLVGWQPAAEFA
jgi:D-alanine-D-alanine ligase